MVLKTVFILSALAFSGCASCTGCFTSEVSSLYQQEVQNTSNIRNYTKDLIEDEFLAIRGAGDDMMRGFEYESYNPQDYFRSLSEIFCPCP